MEHEQKATFDPLGYVTLKTAKTKLSTTCIALHHYPYLISIRPGTFHILDCSFYSLQEELEQVKQLKLNSALTKASVPSSSLRSGRVRKRAEERLYVGFHHTG